MEAATIFYAGFRGESGLSDTDAAIYRWALSACGWSCNCGEDWAGQRLPISCPLPRYRFDTYCSLS